MKNALCPRDPAARRRIRAERQAAKETDRASGIRLDLVINLMLMGRKKEETRD